MFWAIVISVKLLVSYFTTIKPVMWLTLKVQGRDAFGPYVDDDVWDYKVFSDKRNHFTLVIPMWSITSTLFFFDLELWYVLLGSLWSAARGMMRRVGENMTVVDVAHAACVDSDHRLFSELAPEAPESRTGEWAIERIREMLESWRTEDIVSNSDLRKLTRALVGEDTDEESRPDPRVLRALLSPRGAENDHKLQEVRRRLTFLVNSLSGIADQNRKLEKAVEALAYGTLVPYYAETVVYQLSDLFTKTRYGLTQLDYLRTIYPSGEMRASVRCLLQSSLSLRLRTRRLEQFHRATHKWCTSPYGRRHFRVDSRDR